MATACGFGRESSATYLKKWNKKKGGIYVGRMNDGQTTLDDPLVALEREINTKYRNNSSPHSSSSFISAHMFNSNYPSNLGFPFFWFLLYLKKTKEKREKQICRNLRCAFDFIVFHSIRSIAAPSAHLNCFSSLLTASPEMDVVMLYVSPTCVCPRCNHTERVNKISPGSRAKDNNQNKKKDKWSPKWKMKKKRGAGQSVSETRRGKRCDWCYYRDENVADR